MRVLWFSNSVPLKFSQNVTHHYFGGGWIDSLEDIVSVKVELAVSFFSFIKQDKLKVDSTIYYPIYKERSRETPFKSILNNIRGKVDDEKRNLQDFLHVISDFKPDLIHIFGTEGSFGVLVKHTTIPVIIHIQGLLNPILNAYYPIGVSKLNFLFSRHYFFGNFIGNSPYYGIKKFLFYAKREKEILSQVRYLMGRTYWDKTISHLFAPSAEYFHVNEVLRPQFYEACKKHSLSSTKVILISTLSPSVYKGIDFILKSACQICNSMNLVFEWRIVGLSSNDKLLRHFENTLKISHKKNSIICLGKLPPEKLIEQLLDSDIYVHTSYIDNSPNSLCEAQIIGLPVIAFNVGGVSSIVEHNKTGTLIPSNGVFEFLAVVSDYLAEKGKYLDMAKLGKEKAFLRHKKSIILSDLLNVYKKIIA